GEPETPPLFPPPAGGGGGGEGRGGPPTVGPRGETPAAPGSRAVSPRTSGRAHPSHPPLPRAPGCPLSRVPPASAGAPSSGFRPVPGLPPPRLRATPHTGRAPGGGDRWRLAPERPHAGARPRAAAA